jgi:O-antigen/teichoic acid export membrane protein
MGIVKKQGIPGTALTYFGFGLGYVNMVLLFPNLLTENQLGLTRVLISFSLVFQQFSLLGSSNITYRYFPYFKIEGTNKSRGFLLLVLLIGLIGFFVVSSLLLLFQDTVISWYSAKSPLFVDEFELVFLLAVSMVLFNLLESFIRSNLHFVTPIFLKEVFIRLLNLLFIALYAFGVLDFAQFLILFCSTYMLSAVYAFAFAAFKGIVDLKPDFSFIREKKLLKPIADYGAFSVLSSASWMLMNNIDILMIAPMLGEGYAGIYSIALYVGTLVHIPQRTISRIGRPLIAKFWAEERIDEIRKIYKKTAISQTLVGGILLLIIWFNVDFLFLFLPETYQSAKWVILIIGLARLTDMSFSLNNEILDTSRYYRANFLILIVLIAMLIGFNLLMIPRYGMEGAALATLTAFILFNLIKYLYIKWIAGIGVFTWRNAFAFAMILILLLLNHFIQLDLDVIWQGILKTSIAVGLYTFVAFRMNLSEDFNGMITGGMKRLGLRN